MGAYYAYQVTNDENRINYSTFNLEKKFRLEKYSVGGMKFLESFYNANQITQALYLILKKIGKPAVVSTICDYDEPGEFKEQMEWNSGFKKTSFDAKEIGKFLREKNKFGKKILFDFEYELSFQGNEFLEITKIDDTKDKKTIVKYFKVILEMFEAVHRYIKEENGNNKLESYKRIIPKKISSL